MRNRWWTTVALGCAAMTATLSAVAEEDATPKTATFVRSTSEQPANVLILRQANEDVDELVAFYDAEQTPAKYWIGVSCEAVSDSLRSQLALEENVGLLVNEVMDESPAKAAGIQPHDVLISVALKTDGSAEERTLTEIGDLSAVVQKAETKPLSLILFRKGKQQAVELAPVERPKQEEARFEFINVDVPHHGNPEKVQSLLHQLQQELGGGPRGVRLHTATPVVVAAPPQATQYGSMFAFAGSGLPEGMTLTITKSGNNPARIEVKKGEGQVWGANENEIDTLPPEAQGLAKSAISGMSQPNFTIAVSPPSYRAGNVRFTAPFPPGQPMSPYAPVPMAARPHPEDARELADLHRKLFETMVAKGEKHPEVQQLKAQFEAVQADLAMKTKATAAQNTYRSAFTNRLTESEPAIRPPQPAPVQQQQIELLQKQIQELTHMQAKQAEAQQQQMRELQRVLEKIATKE